MQIIILQMCTYAWNEIDIVLSEKGSIAMEMLHFYV